MPIQMQKMVNYDAIRSTCPKEGDVWFGREGVKNDDTRRLASDEGQFLLYFARAAAEPAGCAT